MDDLNVLTQEFCVKVTPSSEIKQIDSLLLLIVHVVRWIRITLHNLPLEELTEAQLEHEASDSVSDLLAFLHECVNLYAVNELGA